MDDDDDDDGGGRLRRDAPGYTREDEQYAAEHPDESEDYESLLRYLEKTKQEGAAASGSGA